MYSWVLRGCSPVSSPAYWYSQYAMWRYLLVASPCLRRAVLTALVRKPEDMQQMESLQVEW